MKKTLIVSILFLLTLAGCSKNKEYIDILLKNVTDKASSYTIDELPDVYDGLSVSWKSFNPSLYYIDNNQGKVLREGQTHKSQTVDVEVTITQKDGKKISGKKQITVGPIIYDALPNTPVATYFSTSAMSSYILSSSRYKEEQTYFSESTIEVLDILYYAFATITANGTCFLDNASFAADVIKLKNTNTRIILSVDGVGIGSNYFLSITGNKNLRKTFVNNLLDLVDQYKFDGLDIDWESIPGSYVVAANMNNLMKELREEMTNRQESGGTPYYLTCAVPASSWGAAPDRFDFKTLNTYVDYINIMSYDMNNQALASHLSPLYASPNDNGYGFGVDYGFKLLTNRGLDSSKIIIGASGYGKAYKLTSEGSSIKYPGLGVSASLTSLGVSGSFASGTVFGSVILELLNDSNYKKYNEYDNNGRFVGTYLYSESKNIFITYDSKESILAKYDYIKKIKGAGIMFWGYAQDPSDTVIDALYEASNS